MCFLLIGEKFSSLLQVSRCLIGLTFDAEFVIEVYQFDDPKSSSCTRVVNLRAESDSNFKLKANQLTHAESGPEFIKPVVSLSSVSRETKCL